MKASPIYIPAGSSCGPEAFCFHRWVPTFSFLVIFILNKVFVSLSVSFLQNVFLQVGEATHELIWCVALTRVFYGDGHWKLAQAFASLAHSYLVLRGLYLMALGKVHEKHGKIMKSALQIQACKKALLDDEVNTSYMHLFTNLSKQTFGQSHHMVFALFHVKSSYLNLRKAERLLEELQGLDRVPSVNPGLKISEKDLVIGLGRTCLQQNKLEAATVYFEKAANAVISSEGNTAPELIQLYEEVAQTEQLKKNCDRAISYLLQVRKILVITKLSVAAARTGLLLGRAYAAAGRSSTLVGVS
uniref:Tetratricopeptide repeat domain 23 like n=1 Tax=Apteryx owenii TaxID=8824 RepID=A0A8B9PNQ4_APTOW